MVIFMLRAFHRNKQQKGYKGKGKDTGSVPVQDAQGGFCLDVETLTGQEGGLG